MKDGTEKNPRHGASLIILTFVYVRRQAPHKHLTREALDALPVLVGVAVGRTEDTRDTLVAVAVVEKIVVDWEERGAAWQRWTGRWDCSKSEAGICRKRTGSAASLREHHFSSIQRDRFESIALYKMTCPLSSHCNAETKQQLKVRIMCSFVFGRSVTVTRNNLPSAWSSMADEAGLKSWEQNHVTSEAFSLLSVLLKIIKLIT